MSDRATRRRRGATETGIAAAATAGTAAAEADIRASETLRAAANAPNTTLAQLRSVINALSDRLDEQRLAQAEADCKVSRQAVEIADQDERSQIRQIKQDTIAELDRALAMMAIDGDSGLERAQAELVELVKLCAEMQLAIDNGVNEDVDLPAICRINLQIFRLLTARVVANHSASQFPAPEQRLRYAQNYFASVKAQARQIPAVYSPIYEPDVISKHLTVHYGLPPPGY